MLANCRTGARLSHDSIGIAEQGCVLNHYAVPQRDTRGYYGVLTTICSKDFAMAMG